MKAETIRYSCTRCGKIHEEWPALAYISPTNYDILSEDDKKNIGEISSDFCIIKHPDQTDRFIRCTLTQKVVDHCEDLEYGLWVSLSEKSFQNYSENFKNENHQEKYFGWLSNDIAEYEFSESIPTTVFTRGHNQRPEIIPFQDFDHPFVHDYYNGITKKEAETRIKEMIRKLTQPNPKKPWWKIW